MSGAAYSRTASTVCSPASISGTSFGHATAVNADARVERADERLVAAGGDRRLRREQADPPVARRADRGGGLGRDHADDRHGERLLERGQRRRGGGVAGDDDQLHALRLEVAGDLVREAADLRRAAAARTAGARGRRGRGSPRSASSRGTRGGRSGRRRRSRRRRSAARPWPAILGSSRGGGAGPDRNVLVGRRRADQALVPAGAAADASGSRYYAERFSTVEVDSTFYRVPTEQMVQGWADRTPAGFVMHVKAFGLMTRHPVRLEQLPPDLRDGMPVDDRGRVDRPPRELRAVVFREFLDALEPLRAGGQARRDPLPAAAVRRPEARRRSTTSSGRTTSSAATRCSSSSATAPGSRRSVRAEVLALARGAADVVRDGRRAEGRRGERPADGRRGDGAARLRPLPRPQRRHLEQARRRRGASASTTSTPRRSCASGSSRCASSPAPPSRPTRSSTTTTRPTASPRRRPARELLRRLLEEHGVAVGVALEACACSRSTTARRCAGALRRRDHRRGARARRVGDRRAPRPAGDFDAVLVLGGHQNVGEEDGAPVARGRVRAAARAGSPTETPLFGDLPRRPDARARVRRPRRALPEQQAGFAEVWLTEEGARDPVLGVAARSASRRSSATTTASSVPDAASRSPTRPCSRRPSGSASAPGPCSSTRRRAATRRSGGTRPTPDGLPRPLAELERELDAKIGGWHRARPRASAARSSLQQLTALRQRRRARSGAQRRLADHLEAPEPAVPLRQQPEDRERDAAAASSRASRPSGASRP